MIIPDGHHSEPKKPDVKRPRVSAVKVGDNYQTKVDQMLVKMAIGTKVRIDRVCKKETQPKFIQAIKNFIDQNDWGGGIHFSSDWKSFSKTEIPDEKIVDEFQDTQNNQRREAVARRNLVFRYWRQRLNQSPIPKFCHNSAEYAITDPTKTIESGLTALKHSKIGSHTFSAWINRMESLGAAMQRHDKSDVTFDNHNKPTVFNPVKK